MNTPVQPPPSCTRRADAPRIDRGSAGDGAAACSALSPARINTGADLQTSDGGPMQCVTSLTASARKTMDPARHGQSQSAESQTAKATPRPTSGAAHAAPHEAREGSSTAAPVAVCILGASLKLGRALALVAALGSFGAEAAPPPGADPNSATARWVRTLKNQWGASCCNDADCRPTMARQTAAGWEVWIDAERYPGGTNAWEPVSEEVLRGTKADGPAPDSRTWACFYGGRVNCFLVGGGF